MNTENKPYFNASITAYLKRYGILEQAEEYARVNSVGIDRLGYGKGKDSLWWAFSWSDTHEGYSFWSNHFQRYLIEQRSNQS